MAERAKKSSRRDLVDTILDSVADGVFTVDKHWIITSFNRAAEKIIGIDRKDAIGQHCFDVFHANICQDACALRETIATDKSIVDQRIDVLDSRGRVLPVSISTAVLRDGQGKVIGGVETFRDLSAVEELKKELHKQYRFEDIISKNHRILEIFDILPDIAESDSTVLIQGPSGSGKELFARAIHNLSRRKQGPYVVVTCAALPDTLLESELFGYVKGAFTDAKKDKPGRFALAEGGTIFLDEVGDISPQIQAKLLRVIQEREFEPLGGTAPVKADVRIVAATNRNLQSLVQKGAVREDLYYRLNVLRIDLPPLSQRREDIPLLVDHCIRRFNARLGKNVARVSKDVMALLMRYELPGNVRELENIIEHGMILCRGAEIGLAHLPPNLTEGARKKARRPAKRLDPLSEAEARTILEALRRHDGHRGHTAAELGIDKSTLWRKMNKYRIKEI